MQSIRLPALAWIAVPLAMLGAAAFALLPGILPGILGANDPQSRQPEPCVQLFELVDDAQGCDPHLGLLADQLRDHGDEQRCAAVLNAWSTTDAAPRAAALSIHAVTVRPGANTTQRTPADLRAALPARLEVHPRFALKPGDAQTLVLIDGERIDTNAHGVSAGFIGSGRHTLYLLHAGSSAGHCIDAQPCAQVVLRTLGAQLQLDRAAASNGWTIRAGACSAADESAVGVQ